MHMCCMQLIMNVPFTAVHFATYESAKTAMARWAGWEHEEETLLVQLLAGEGSCPSSSSVRHAQGQEGVHQTLIGFAICSANARSNRLRGLASCSSQQALYPLEFSTQLIDNLRRVS